MTAEATQADAPQSESAPEETKFRRRLIGQVSRDKMDKTVVVDVTRFKMHAKYKKYVRVRTKYKAHDEGNEYRTGDRVEITEHRPLSKEKRWKVSRLIERGIQE